MIYLLNDLKFEYGKNCFHFNPHEMTDEAEMLEVFSDEGWRKWELTGWRRFMFTATRYGLIRKAERIPVGTRGKLIIVMNGELVGKYDVEFRGMIRSRWPLNRKYKVRFRGRKLAA